MSDDLREQEARSSADQGSGVLWIGILLPPITWALQMQVNYWMVRGACARLSNLALFTVTLIALTLVLIAGLSAWLGWRKVGQKWPSSFGDVISRRRFMAVLGLFMTAMFALVITAQGIAAIMIPPCQL
jgi:hypothetical protein